MEAAGGLEREEDRKWKTKEKKIRGDGGWLEEEKEIFFYHFFPITVAVEKLTRWWRKV